MNMVTSYAEVAEARALAGVREIQKTFAKKRFPQLQEINNFSQKQVKSNEYAVACVNNDYIVDSLPDSVILQAGKQIQAEKLASKQEGYIKRKYPENTFSSFSDGDNLSKTPFIRKAKVALLTMSGWPTGKRAREIVNLYIQKWNEGRLI